jgi:hypothetical protein
MLKMRIVRAPLSEEENRVILDEYNRLTSGNIPLGEFVHWLADGPEGPAWHAILETEGGRIVGHICAFPLRAGHAASCLIPAKVEYGVVHEDFRREKICGHETVGRPPFIILLDQLFRHCHEQGWGPLFASTNAKNQVFTRKVGLRPIEFPVTECLLVLRPLNAAGCTPNLRTWQRTALYAVGLAHSAIWPLAARILFSANGIKEVPTWQGNGISKDRLFSFFEDVESQRWRYPGGQYVRFEMRQHPGEYLIAKRGSDSGYLRICQWRLDSAGSFLPLFAALVREARKGKAVGVRWAVYDGDPAAKSLVKQMKRAGFLCARRNRIVMIHKKDEKYLDPALWRINDSLFSFDP